jgi:signal peptide peptidase SppA
MDDVTLQTLRSPWAILPDALNAAVAQVQRYIAGDAVAIDAARQSGRPTAIQGDIAVMNLNGTIWPRGGGAIFGFFGLTSAEQFGRNFMAAMTDSRIGAVVIDTSSPGGAVSGIDELSKLIFEARGSKPIVAVANHLMASAAYWIGTAADELVVTPSGEVGSVGVFAAHQDASAALERAGVKTTLISAGKFKTEGNPYEPLTDEARASLQARVDDYYGMFVKAVARNRGVGVNDVRNGFGEGRVVGAQQAVALGMADRVETLDQVLERLSKRQRGGRSASAELEFRKAQAWRFKQD